MKLQSKARHSLERLREPEESRKTQSPPRDFAKEGSGPPGSTPEPAGTPRAGPSGTSCPTPPAPGVAAGPREAPEHRRARAHRTSPQRFSHPARPRARPGEAPQASSAPAGSRGLSAVQRRAGAAEGPAGSGGRAHQALCWNRRAGSVRKRLPNGRRSAASLGAAMLGRAPPEAEALPDAATRERAGLGGHVGRWREAAPQRGRRWRAGGGRAAETLLFPVPFASVRADPAQAGTARGRCSSLLAPPRPPPSAPLPV